MAIETGENMKNRAKLGRKGVDWWRLRLEAQGIMIFLHVMSAVDLVDWKVGLLEFGQVGSMRQWH